MPLINRSCSCVALLNKLPVDLLCPFLHILQARLQALQRRARPLSMGFQFFDQGFFLPHFRAFINLHRVYFMF